MRAADAPRQAKLLRNNRLSSSIATPLLSRDLSGSRRECIQEVGKESGCRFPPRPDGLRPLGVKVEIVAIPNGLKTTTIFGVAEEAQALGYRTLALSNHLVAESLMVKMIARSAANGYGISEATRQKSWALQLGFEDDQAEAARQDYDAVLCEHHLEFIRSLESAALGTPETEVEKMLTGVRKSDLVIYLASNPVVASQRKGGPLGRDVAALGRMDNLLESRARECPNWFRVETVERESEAIVGDCFAAILQFAFRKSLIPDRSTWLCMTQSTDSIERSLE